MTSSTATRPKHHGKPQRQAACHWLTHMHSGEKIQFIQLRTAPPKSCHITSVTTPGTASNTTTHLRSHGRPRLQMVCHWLAPTPSTNRLQFIQLKIVNQRSFRTTNVTTHSMMSSITTPQRNHGRPRRRTACHWRVPMHSMLDRSIQQRTVNPKSCRTISATTHGTKFNITTPLKNLGKSPRQTECHSQIHMLSHRPSRKRVYLVS